MKNWPLLSLASIFVAFSLFACTTTSNPPQSCVDGLDIDGNPCETNPPNGSDDPPTVSWPDNAEPCFSPVQCYGKLKAQGNRIVGSKTEGTPVQVRGLSFGWSNSTWESGKFFAADAATRAVNGLVDGWKAEVIRVPMGANNEEGVNRVINAAINKGVYVVIDWHSHNAHNEVSQATAFFTRMAQAHGRHDNVIFEIYNEPVCPDGGTSCAAAQRTTWATIKDYADRIIPVIRQHSDNLILVGTPFYCQDPQKVLDAPGPLADPNVAYVLHFYSYSHKIALFSGRVTNALNNGLPIFVSEWGTTHSDGGQNNAGNLNSHDAVSSDQWMEFLNTHQISSAAWQLNYKNEGSSFFVPSFTPASSDYSNTGNMTASGKYINNMLVQWAQQSQWRKMGGQ